MLRYTLRLYKLAITFIVTFIVIIVITSNITVSHYGCDYVSHYGSDYVYHYGTDYGKIYIYILTFDVISVQRI